MNPASLEDLVTDPGHWLSPPGLAPGPAGFPGHPHQYGIGLHADTGPATPSDSTYLSGFTAAD